MPLRDTKVLANSHGFVGEYRRSYCSISAVPIAQTEDDGMQARFTGTQVAPASGVGISRTCRQSCR